MCRSDVALERRALRRGDAAPDRFEAENVEFHEKLREAFRALAIDEPERCVIIDASAPRVEVAKDIWDTVQAKLDPATAPLRRMCWRRKTWFREARIMSPQANEDSEAPHPRTTAVLFGHADAEAALLAAYRSGRMPHAFLIAGPKGIGKATLAYRMARFVLAHPDPAAPEVARGDVARRRSGASGGAPDRGAGRSPISSFSSARSTTRACCASRSPSMTCAAP